jgi:hypothetical protein
LLLSNYIENNAIAQAEMLMVEIDPNKKKANAFKPCYRIRCFDLSNQKGIKIVPPIPCLINYFSTTTKRITSTKLQNGSYKQVVKTKPEQNTFIKQS